MSENWVQLLKCKVCGRLPYIVPVSRKKVQIMCDHGQQQVGVQSYENAEAWNKANKEPTP